jgi:RNA polymerase-binding transcription factor DksA
MAEFYSTKGIAFRIEEIIVNAKSKVILMSPYLKISSIFLSRIKEASNRNVSITIIYGKDELKKEERESLSKIDNLELYFYKELHAKCYFNEKEMIITSMNLYDYSEMNNREMGVSLKKSEDKEAFEKAYKEAKAIKDGSEHKRLRNSKEIKQTKRYSNKNNRKERYNNKYNKHEGYCIRCGMEISKNTDRPFCRDCYDSWSWYENIDYPENYCHICGKDEETTMEKPLCYNCYKKHFSNFQKSNWW